MMGKTESSQRNFEGARVLITSGDFAGLEGICLGKTQDPNLWAVSPDASADVISLRFEKDFGLLVDLSLDPGASRQANCETVLAAVIPTTSHDLKSRNPVIR